MTPPLPIPELHYKVIGTRNCAYAECGKSFPVKSTFLGKKYCCFKCWNASRTHSHISICSFCKKLFDNRRKCGIRSLGRKYCSEECRAAAKKAGAVEHPCLICDRDTGKYNRLYCSGECRKTARELSKPKKKIRVSIQYPPRGTMRPEDIALYERIIKVGAVKAGEEFGFTVNAVRGRLWRAGIRLSERRKAA